MTWRRMRLAPVAIAAWTAAAGTALAPASAWIVALVLWGAVLAALTAGLVRRRAGGVVVIVVVALAVAAAAASAVALAQPSRSVAAAVAAGRTIEVRATVIGKAERRAAGDVAFDAQVHGIRAGRRELAVEVPVVVRARDAGRPPVGARIVARGTARRTDAGDRAVLVVRADREVEVVAPPAGLLAVAAGLRSAFVAATHDLPPPAAGLIPGLAIGDTAAVDAQLDADMKTSSLAHLTAVSGSNCVIIVGIAFAIAAAAGARRGVRVAVALAALAGFVVLVTPEPSVVRAATMAAIAMLAVTLGRTGAGVSLLSLAVAAALIADPWLATSLGFALSAVATAALLVLARPLAAGLARWMPRALALALSVPLAAQLACGPLLILVNPTVPLYGVIANLLADPAAPLATVVGLAACLAAPVPALQAGLTALSWLPAAWIASTAATASAMPGSAAPWPEGWVGAVLLALAGATVAVLVASRSRGRAARATRVSCAIAVAATVAAGAGTAVADGVAVPFAAGRAWAVAACDIGQGDAVLVRSDDQVGLIDTGPSVAALSRCLSRLGIARIDLLVLTHYDLDHVGGTRAVVGRVGTVLHGPLEELRGRRLIADLIDGGAHAVPAHAGQAGMLGTARWTVLWPPAHSRVFTSGNEASIVLDVRGGAVPAALFLGDVDALAQRALARTGTLAPPYAIVKVAHHGSADQDPDLYRTLRPAVALISVGLHNDYGHPRASTLAFLTADGALIARTDREGAVTVASGEDGLVVRRERAPP